MLGLFQTGDADPRAGRLGARLGYPAHWIGATLPHQLCVVAVLRERRVGVTERADFLGPDKSIISGLIDGAVSRGLLERSPDAVDGRAVDVHLAAQGSGLAEIGAAEIESVLTPMARVLCPRPRRYGG